MGILGNIMDRIFHHPARAEVKPASAQAVPQTTSSAASAPAVASQPVPTVDVGAVLESMAAMRTDAGGNYRSSIVDLLKLLDLDSSVAARKELADELGIHAGADGSAEQNIALHKAVMDKLADNGGIVPDSLRN